MIETVKTLLGNENQANVLNMITAIEITTSNDEVYNACLEIRNQLVPDSYRQGNSLRWDFLQAKDEQVRKKGCDSEGQEGADGVFGESEK